MFVCCESFVLSGRGLCDGLIPRPKKSYRLWCVVVCDLETSWMRRSRPTGDCRAKSKQTYRFKSSLQNLTFLLSDNRNTHYYYYHYYYYYLRLFLSFYLPCSSLLLSFISYFFVLSPPFLYLRVLYLLLVFISPPF